MSLVFLSLLQVFHRFCKQGACAMLVHSVHRGLRADRRAFRFGACAVMKHGARVANMGRHFLVGVAAFHIVQPLTLLGKARLHDGPYLVDNGIVAARLGCHGLEGFDVRVECVAGCRRSNWRGQAGNEQKVCVPPCKEVMWLALVGHGRSLGLQRGSSRR